MSAAAMLSKLYTLLFFIIASSQCGAGYLQHQLLVKRAADIKQNVEDCFTQLNNSLPQTCNFSVLTTTVPDAPANVHELATLNEAYARNCISACIDPILEYLQCTYPDNSSYSFFRSYLSNIIQNGVCRQEDGEYCPVRIVRLNYTVVEFSPCEQYRSNNFTIVCNQTTPRSCYNHLSTLSQRLGCCAAGYFPPLQNCGITVDSPCAGTSPANGPYPLAALSMIAVAIAILGIFF
uniref:Uncharacterized protein n=1 Tax=Amphimedon queenslandica TaxID=400682 RepID=A0A1X7U363_AMPQE